MNFTDDRPRVPRMIVRSVNCPECGAIVNEKCKLSRVRRDGTVYREQNHLDRVYAYLENIK